MKLAAVCPKTGSESGPRHEHLICYQKVKPNVAPDWAPETGYQIWGQKWAPDLGPEMGTRLGARNGYPIWGQKLAPYLWGARNGYQIWGQKWVPDLRPELGPQVLGTRNRHQIWCQELAFFPSFANAKGHVQQALSLSSCNYEFSFCLGLQGFLNVANLPSQDQNASA